MSSSVNQEKPRDLIDKGFDLDKRVNKVLAVLGLGVAAVGSVVAAPAVAVFGATVAGGKCRWPCCYRKPKGWLRKHEGKKSRQENGHKGQISRQLRTRRLRRCIPGNYCLH